MRKLLIAVMIFSMALACNEGMSQTETIADSSAIGKKFNQLESLIKRDLDSALVFSRQINQQAKAIGYQQGILESMLFQGKILRQLGSQDSSISVLSEVLAAAKKQNNRLTEIKAYTQLALAWEGGYDFQTAVANLIQAEQLLKNTDPFDLRFDIFNQLGTVHRKMKDYHNALKYFAHLEENFFYQLDSVQRFLLFMNTGNVYADQKDYKKTEELFNKAYTAIEKEDDPVSIALITYNLGALYYRQKRFAEAEDFINKSLIANLKIGNQFRIELSYRVLGAINMDRGNHLEAEKYFFKALKIAEEIDNPKSILGNYKNLYLNYAFLEEKTGKTSYLRKQLDYYRKWANLNDSLYQAETAGKILELEKQYETEKKNDQIALLEKDNRLKEDEIFLQRTQRNYLIVVIVLFGGILSIFIYFFYYYKKVNRLLQVQGKRILQQKDQIAEQNKQLQKSIDTQNKLFSIIAHDLRSPLVSISNFSKLIAFYIEDKQYTALEDVARLMDKKNDAILDLTDNLLNWAKSQTQSLRPFFEPINLKEIVESCLEVYQPIAGAKAISLSCIDLKEKLLWADRNMLSTICRNLINNAIKFTPQGGNICIYFEEEGTFMTISVKDSGVGIRPEKMAVLFDFNHEKVSPGTDGEKSSGLGLTVCKEFVHAMQGEIWVSSEPGKGSVFSVRLLLFNPAMHPSKHKPNRETPAAGMQQINTDFQK